MAREVIDSPGTPVLGPYSPAVRVGPLLFVSAQSGIVPATGSLPEGGVAAEVRQALTNLQRVLEAAGAELSDVAKTTLLYTSPDDLPTINTVYAEVFPTNPPARTAACVRLPGGRHVSIDAIAAQDLTNSPPSR